MNSRLGLVGLTFACAALLSLSAGAQKTAARPQTGLPPKWEAFDFAHDEITVDQLKDLTPLQLKYLRGIVFGRHGRVFQEDAIQNWLKARPWYHPDSEYRVAILNAVERHNMDAIKEAEYRKHPLPQPGDMRFYRDRLLTAKEKRGMQKERTSIELLIMRAEIEAIHGKRFDDTPWLQKFFEERYWYTPDPNYTARRLNESERKNLAVLTEITKDQRHVALLPGDMGTFQDSPITPELLRGLNLYELRLLRNEVYARRGKRFHTPWLQQHFAEDNWYKPLLDFRDPPLTPVEIKNVAVIVLAERRIHGSLSTQPLRAESLENLFVEDARKLRYEILARHGKTFKDRWLDGYFRSFAWYKPDPKFDPKALSAVEKRNVATLLVYEKKAERKADTTPA